MAWISGDTLLSPLLLLLHLANVAAVAIVIGTIILQLSFTNTLQKPVLFGGHSSIDLKYRTVGPLLYPFQGSTDQQYKYGLPWPCRPLIHEI